MRALWLLVAFACAFGDASTSINCGTSNGVPVICNPDTMYCQDFTPGCHCLPGYVSYLITAGVSECVLKTSMTIALASYKQTLGLNPYTGIPASDATWDTQVVTCDIVSPAPTPGALLSVGGVQRRTTRGSGVCRSTGPDLICDGHGTLNTQYTAVEALDSNGISFTQIAFAPDWGTSIGITDGSGASNQCECDPGYTSKPTSAFPNGDPASCAIAPVRPVISCGSGTRTSNGITYRVPYVCDEATMQCNIYTGIGCMCKDGFIALNTTRCVQNTATNVVIGSTVSFTRSGQSVTATCDVPKTGNAGYTRCHWASGNTLNICSNHGYQDLLFPTSDSYQNIQLAAALPTYDYPYDNCVCDPGWGGIECNTCAAGYYLSGGSCVACEVGTFQGTTGTSSSCTNCAAGTFSNTVGSSSCTRCAVRTFQPTAGSTSCTTCVTSVGTGDSTCRCPSCGSNSTCKSDGSCLCDTGFIPYSNTQCHAVGTLVPTTDTESSALSTGAIAGISIGGVLAVCMALFAAWKHFRHPAKAAYTQSHSEKRVRSRKGGV